MSIKDFFSEDQKQAIQKAIADAELNTSGEICVHIDSKCKGDGMEAATKTFNKLNMHKTALRNGVLFYLAVEDKKFAIIGDKGINDNVPGDFWDTIRNTMLSYFKNQQFAEGLCKGIEMAGQKLKTYFPLQKNDTNELSNDVSFGN